MLEKFQHAENNFQNFKHAVEKKSKEVKEFEKAEKRKYEINTNLPLARARRLKSDVHDFSSALLTIGRPVLENWTKPNSRPSATPLFSSFF